MRVDYRSTVAVLGACVMGVCIGSSSARAQPGLPRNTVTVAAGFTQYDIRGEGYVPMTTMSIDRAFAGNWILLEAGAAYIPLRTQFAADRTNLLAFQGQVQLQLPLRHVQPYVGIGGGWMTYLNNPDSDGAITELATFATGLRIPVSSSWLVRGEGRLHLWEPSRGSDDAFVQGAAGVTFGLSRRF